MDLRKAIASVNFRDVLHAASRFASWWLEEFSQLLPQKLSNWLFGRRPHRLLLSAQAGGVLAEILGDGGRVIQSRFFRQENYSFDGLAALFAASAPEFSRVPVGLWAPEHAAFVRFFNAPPLSRTGLVSLAQGEIEHHTPFQLDDVAFSITPTPVAGSKLWRIRQIILRKDIVASAARALGLDLAALAFVAVGPPEERARDIVPLLVEGLEKPAMASRIGLALAGLGAALLPTYLAVALTTQASAINRLSTDLEPARKEAQSARSRAEELARLQTALQALQARLSKPGKGEIWEELSARIPDDSWLTELRITDEGASIGGFSGAATRLIGLLENSPMFENVAFSAPIALDQANGRERFAITLKLRPAVAANEAERRKR